MSRDRILEQALTQQLRSATSPVTDECLDAETLAAWSDGALDAAQSALMEAHLSSCARCQAMLGAFARSTSAMTPAVESGGVRWLRWWMAPLAAGAAAVTIWMVVPEQQEIATAPARVEAPATAVGSVAPAPAAIPHSEAAAPPQAKQGVEAKPAGRVPSSFRENAAPLRDQNRLADAPAAPRADATAKEGLEVAAVAGSPEPPVAAAAAPPAAPAVAGLQNSNTSKLQSLPRARFAFAPVEVVSPTPAQRWRAIAAGIERSEDGGKSWTLVRVDTGDAIVAGSSPSPTVCWLVGSAGVVLVTTDGRNFVRHVVPGREDLFGVTAVDAQNASVTTASGRTIQTRDGGTSWQ